MNRGCHRQAKQNVLKKLFQIIGEYSIEDTFSIYRSNLTGHVAISSMNYGSVSYVPAWRQSHDLIARSRTG